MINLILFDKIRFIFRNIRDFFNFLNIYMFIRESEIFSKYFIKTL